MEEAECLCDRVLIMDHGKIVALDTPEALIRTLGGERRVVFTLPPDPSIGEPINCLPQGYRIEQTDGHLTVYGRGDRFVSSVVYALEDAGVPFLDLRTAQPSLEDVFLALTGREMRE
jgi:ABC-2 type transport system ATP-binding protein